MSTGLPHAYPFVLVDRVEEVEPALRAVARRTISSTDPLLDECGQLSPTLLMEAIAQCAGVAAAGLAEGSQGVLVGFDRFRVVGRVAAGDALEIRARVVRRFGALIKARGRVRANGRLRAVAEVTLRLAAASERR
jgi:3-hydroxyacyl-[acyl-carrier-protein] dehydratase